MRMHTHRLRSRHIRHTSTSTSLATADAVHSILRAYMLPGGAAAAAGSSSRQGASVFLYGASCSGPTPDHGGELSLSGALARLTLVTATPASLAAIAESALLH